MLAGLAACGLALASCSGSQRNAYDLTAPRQPVRGGGLGGTLVVAEPATIAPLEEERILAKDAAGAISYLADAQWADRLPRLLQARLVQTFENATRIRAVGRAGDGVVGEYQLNTEIRAFQLDSARGEAYVEVSAKVLDTQSGKIVNARVFTGRSPVPDVSGNTVAQVLDQVLSFVMLDIVRWVGTGH